MQPLRIVIDVRHIKDFGIGTYIRNLVKALGELDQREPLPACRQRRGHPGLRRTCRRTSRRVVYHEPKQSRWDDIAYPWFLRGLAAGRCPPADERCAAVHATPLCRDDSRHE